MDRDTALRKIQKCLNLSKSSEPHEAARALEQAQKLMEQFNVDHPELLAAGVEAGDAFSRARKSPPSYEVRLANVIADSFGCNMVFVPGSAARGSDGAYRFIGVGTAGQIASYTFAVLARKLTAARVEYTRAKLARYTKNKVAAADEFCMGWVRAVSLAVHDAPEDEQRDASLVAYMEREYPELGQLKPRRRELANTTRSLDHQISGFVEGKKAYVNTGVGSSQGDARFLSFSR